MNEILVPRRRRRLVVVWTVIGFLAAVAVWVGLVVAASIDVSTSEAPTSGSSGILGLPMVTAGKGVEPGGGTSATLSPETGALLLLSLPLLGIAIGFQRSRAAQNA